MSLQAKLFTFFIAIVVVPLTVVALLTQHDVSGLLRQKDRDRVDQITPGAVALYAERIGEIPGRAAALGADPDVRRTVLSGDTTAIQVALKTALKPGTLDFAAILNGDGEPVTQVLVQATYLPGIKTPTVQEMLVTETADGQPTAASLLASYTTVPAVERGSTNGPAARWTLLAGDYLDNNFAAGLWSGTNADVTIVVKGQAVASSLVGAPGSPRPWTVTLTTATSHAVETKIGGQAVDARAQPLRTGVPVATASLVTSGLLANQVFGGALVAAIFGFLIVAVVGAALLAFAVTRAIARPLRELAAGADAIAAGNYDQHIAVTSRDEVGRFARAFNAMTERLATHIAELQESKEELKRSLARFGETLRSTHDLDKILQVVLDTSVDALGASSGLLFVVRPYREGAELVVAAARGIEGTNVSLKAGEGIAGAVAVSGEPIWSPASGDDPSVPASASVEPACKTGLWVPVFAQGRIYAVLSLFDREEEDFSARDLDTVLSLADQAGVAIDNVVLHQEAQRLAITDGMTGIWNHRYFQLRFEQEMDRSTRFRRPFCLLLCDVDDFKTINDTFGHQIGDGVLIDLARRVKSEIRDIDVLARYGGEEFVLILPETDADGGMRAAEKVRRRVAESPFGDQRSIAVTISVGVACFPRAGTDQTTLLRAADVALYQAKARGKNRSILFQAPEEGRAS